MSGPIQIGDFRIERQIGAGGMGVVYLATQVSLNRQVALKVMGQSLHRQSDKMRFKREAQAVARLSHPNIASVHYVGQDNQFCYMAMDYIDGVSLRDCLERLAETKNPESTLDDLVGLASSSKMERFDQLDENLDYGTDTEDSFVPSPVQDLQQQPPQDRVRLDRSTEAEQAISNPRYVRRCAEIARDTANALQHAHDKGVIHRDIKPDNLMLDEDGTVHVIDFGVARFNEDAKMTRTGALVGTPIYMSPEQVTGRMELDPRTDIYSLGILLYELLMLGQPIKADTRDAILRNIVVKPLVPVSRFNASIPDPLQNIVHKATAKNPDDRYRSSKEFADDLSRFLNSKTVLAPRYQYKTDESEIRASMPSSAVFTWLVAWFTGFTLFLGNPLSILHPELLYSFSSGEELLDFQGTLLCGVLYPPLLYFGWRFVNARRGSRFALSVFLGLSLCYFVSDLVLQLEFVLRGKVGDLTELLEPIRIAVMVLVALSGTLLTIFSVRIREWFVLASRVRAEANGSVSTIL